MRGSIIHSDLQSRGDPVTGVTVTRLSDDQSDTNHPYFTVSQVDSDSTCIIVTSNRTGEVQF